MPPTTFSILKEPRGDVLQDLRFTDCTSNNRNSSICWFPALLTESLSALTTDISIWTLRSVFRRLRNRLSGTSASTRLNLTNGFGDEWLMKFSKLLAAINKNSVLKENLKSIHARWCRVDETMFKNYNLKTLLGNIKFIYT